MNDLASLPATFTTTTALQAGIHARDLYRARDVGTLVELSRGVFRQAAAPEPSWPDMLAVQYRAPQAVVCLLSAAFAHNLSDEAPVSVQIALPRGAWLPRIEYPQVEAFSWSRDTFELGLTLIEAAPDEPVRIYSSARTVVDLWRLRHREGEPAAQIALRRYLGSGHRVAELLRIAERLSVLGPLRAATDLLTAS